MRSFSLRKKDRNSGSAGGGSYAGGRISDELFAQNLGLGEPLFDYEALVAEERVRGDEFFAELVEFPADDVSVETVARSKYVVDEQLPRLPRRGAKDYIAACLRFYASDWTVLRRRYRARSPMQDPAAQAAYEASLPVHSFWKEEAHQEQGEEEDANKKKKKKARRMKERNAEASRRLQAASGAEDPLMPEALRYEEGTLAANAAARASARAELFHVFPGAHGRLPTARADEYFQEFRAVPRLRALLKPRLLEFSLGNFEPFVCILALYDIVKCKKVSENMYFHLNSPEVMALLEEPEQLPQTRKALFSLVERSPDVYLVLRIEKVLHGDLDSVTEPYIKHETLKAKDKERAVQAATAACRRLSYRQPFAWAMAPFLDESLKAFDGDIEFCQLYRMREQELSDEAFLAMIQDFSKGGSTKRSKLVPGRCVVRSQPIDDPSTIKGRLTPSLAKIPPVSRSQTVFEMREFPRVPVLRPHLHYVNDLYVYLQSVNLSGRTGSPSAKNIAVVVKLMESDASLNAAGLRAFYAPGKAEMTTSFTSTVVYRSKAPQSYNEIKIALPCVLTPQHHLLFTFYHVNVQAAKGKTQLPVDVPVAYAAWHIYQSDRVATKEVLPVMADLTATAYLQDDAIKYVEGGKLLVAVKAKLHSTVYSQDVHLNNAFKRMKKISTATPASHARAVESLVRVHPVRLIKFCPVVLSYTLQAICSGEETAAKCFRVLPQLLAGIHEEASDARALLGSYADTCFQTARCAAGFVHEVLCRELLRYIRDSEEDCEVLLKYAWWFFRIIFKSMALAMDDPRLAALPRAQRFPESFVVDLRGLLVVLTWEVQQRKQTALTLGKELTRNIACFLTDLLSFMEVGVIFKIIEKFVTEIAPRGCTDLTLIEYQLEFFRVLSEYEHFVRVNVPVPTELEGGVAKAAEHFKQTHFLAGLLVEEVAAYLRSKEKTVRIKAMDALRKFFITHEYCEGDRLRQEPARLERVISMYFPVLLAMVDHPISAEAVFEERRDFLVCFLFLLKHTRRPLLQQWWRADAKRVPRFFSLLALALRTFEYVGREQFLELTKDTSDVKSSDSTKAALESFYSGVGAQPSPSLNDTGTQRRFRKFAQAKQAAEEQHSPQAEQRAFRRTLTRAQGKGVADHAATPAPQRFNEAMEAALAAEASFVVLDALEAYLAAVQRRVAKGEHHALRPALGLLVRLLEANHAQAFLPHLYASLAAFTSRFAASLFDAGAFVGDYCYALLAHCNHEDTANRAHAAALLFLLMKSYFLCRPELFARITVQVTIALSKLVGAGVSTDVYLRRTLSSIARYAMQPFTEEEATPQLYAQFSSAVEKLIERLYGILRDYMRINEFAHDDEMTADLYHRLADGYTNAPCLRLTWLESLGNFHKRKQNWAESAMCSVHIAAMMAEFLHAVEPQEHIPAGSEAFLRVSSNVLVEQSVRTASAVSEKESPEALTFTESALVAVVRQALGELKHGQLFETANELYKLLLPILEKHLLYHEIADAHADLEQLFQAVISCNQTQSRMLGSYYRVAFFGSLFAELDGREFIYKEPKITKLVEIKDRLQEMYGERFGEGKFEIISHSNTVDRAALAAGVAYVQLTSVEPYFSREEVAARPLYFHRNDGISRFFYQTPFTKSGKARSENVAEQYMRKTVLCTERAFPYMKTRLAVEGREEVEISPIENAIEAIDARTAKILAESAEDVASLKTLQPVLSGSVCLQVNAGPLDYSNTFFSKELMPSIAKEHLQAFCASLEAFIAACKVGIARHEALIESEAEIAFHLSLITGLEDMEPQMRGHMARFLGTKGPKRSKSKKKVTK